VRLAARGQRDLDAGVEPIADEAERAQVRRQGRAVHLRALGAALLLTLLALVA
jgi:hypothetical protein